MLAQHSLYDLITPLIRRLKALDAVLVKLEAHCAEHNIKDSVFLNDRLYPDMFPLVSQVRVVTDLIKGAFSRLTGNENPVYEDNEETIAQLHARIAKLLAYADTFKASQFENAESREIVLKMRDGSEPKYTGWDYTNNFVIPNVYFHIMTAYSILRHRGVKLGKADFIG